MCGESPVYALTPAERKDLAAYQYAIRGEYERFIELDDDRTFSFDRGITDATLFESATAAEAAVKYRNEQMGDQVFIIVPVKVTMKTTTTRELA